MLRCGLGLKPWSECLSDEFDDRLLRNEGKPQDTVFNLTACDEIDPEWFDMHPLTALDTVGYSMKQAWKTGVLQYGGKIGGKNAAADAKVHPLKTWLDKKIPSSGRFRKMELP